MALMYHSVVSALNLRDVALLVALLFEYAVGAAPPSPPPTFVHETVNWIEEPPECPERWLLEQSSYALQLPETNQQVSQGETSEQDLRQERQLLLETPQLEVVIPFYEKELCGLRQLLMSLVLHDVTDMISRINLQRLSLAKIEDFE